MKRLVNIFIVSLLLAVSPYLQKKLIRDMGMYNYIAISTISMTAVILTYLSFETDTIKEKMDDKLKLNAVILVIVLSVITVPATLAYYSLVGNNELTYVFPLLLPLVLLLTFLIGFLFLKEEVTSERIAGGLILIVGMYIFTSHN